MDPHQHRPLTVPGPRRPDVEVQAVLAAGREVEPQHGAERARILQSGGPELQGVAHPCPPGRTLRGPEAQTAERRRRVWNSPEDVYAALFAAA
jgi:hypothetical protein